MDLGREAFEPQVDERHRILPEAELVEMLVLAGWAFEVAAGRRETAERETRAALARWIAAGLGFRTAASGERRFDPVEVVQMLKWLGLRGEDSFWADRYVATGRALVEALTGPRFEIAYQRSFDLSRFAPDARLRLRAPMPLRDDLDDLDFSPLPIEGFADEAVLRDGYMEVRGPPPLEGHASLGFAASFAMTAAGETPPLSREARELYLRPTEGLIQVAPEVAALAQRLAGADPGETVAGFWNHLLDELICGPIRYSDLQGRPPVQWVLEKGWYDCQLGSALLASLCRAQGVPARLVGGHLLYPLAPTNHFWTEIWFEGEGWRSYDLLCWDLSAAGRDAAWRDRFAGAVDARLVTQRLPLAFTGPMSVRFPAAWQMTQASFGEGIAVTYRDVEDGSLIFRETISVSRG
jgi:hypothetical protein